MSTDYTTQRAISDIQSRISHIDRNVMAAAQRPRPRPGGLVARFATVQLLARVEKASPADIARRLFRDDRDLAQLIELKTAMSPAQTGVAGWAAELVATVVQDVADNLLPESALAQLRAAGSLAYGFIDGGVARVPVHAPTPSGGFVAESGAIAVGALIIGSLNLRPKKCASIIAATRELLAGSGPNIEISLRTLLSQDVSLTVDSILLGAGAATAAQPAGLLNGLTTLTPTTGGGITALSGDIKALMAAISPAVRPCLIMSTGTAASFGVLAETDAVPVITAPYMPPDQVIAVDAAAFASALGAPDISVNENPALHMEGAAPLPIVGGVAQPPLIGSIAAPVQSLWQTAAVGMRVLIDCDWTVRRSGAVAFISSVTW